MPSSDTAMILTALRHITDQLLLIEQRLESLEAARTNRTVLDLMLEDNDEDTEDTEEGYESAPPSFSYSNNLL